MIQRLEADFFAVCRSWNLPMLLTLDSISSQSDLFSIKTRNICFHLLRFFTWRNIFLSVLLSFLELQMFPTVTHTHTDISACREECSIGIRQSLFKKVQLEFPNSGKTRAWLYISKWLPQQFRCSQNEKKLFISRGIQAIRLFFSWVFSHVSFLE